MKTRWVPAAMVIWLAGCYEGWEGTPELEEEEPRVLPTSVELGVVTGAIYSPDSESFDVPQSFASHGTTIAHDIADGLGATWIRIELGWSGTMPQHYRHLVAAAHDEGLKVLAVVNDTQCGTGMTDAELVEHFRDRFAERYAWFTEEVPDAFELLNEPNQPPPVCGAAPWAVSPQAAVDVLYDTRAHFPGVPLVAGGLLNLAVPGTEHPSEPYWVAYLDALGAAAPDVDPKPVPPVDWFAIHPYNSFDLYDSGTPDLDKWVVHGNARLSALHARLASIYTLPSRPFFVTEFGFESDGDGDTAVGSESIAAEGLKRAVTWFDETGLVDAATWYAYRDYPEGGSLTAMGLRGEYDGTLHPNKPELFIAFAELTGAPLDALDRHWHRGETRVFAGQDDPSPVLGEDWKHGSYKAECPSGQAARGLSVGTADGAAHGMLCSPDDPALDGSHALGVCTVRSMASQDDPVLGPGDTDWDIGYLKGACEPGQAVVGMSQSVELQIDSVLCCPAPVAGTACETYMFGDADGGESNVAGDWDPFYVKNDCSAEGGRFITGVSRDVGSGRPHAIRCCG